MIPINPSDFFSHIFIVFYDIIQRKDTARGQRQY
jgi:hypothetical protein